MSLAGLFNKLRGGLDITRVALSALELIGDLASKAGAKVDRLEKLDLIARIVERIKDAIAGKADVHDVQAEIDKMRADLASNNTTVDGEADDKFDGSDD